MEKSVDRMLIPVYQLGGQHTEIVSFYKLFSFLSTCDWAACVQTGIAVMTGNNVFALPHWPHGNA